MVGTKHQPTRCNQADELGLSCPPPPPPFIFLHQKGAIRRRGSFHLADNMPAVGTSTGSSPDHRSPAPPASPARTTALAIPGARPAGPAGGARPHAPPPSPRSTKTRMGGRRRGGVRGDRAYQGERLKRIVVRVGFFWGAVCALLAVQHGGRLAGIWGGASSATVAATTQADGRFDVGSTDFMAGIDHRRLRASPVGRAVAGTKRLAAQWRRTLLDTTVPEDGVVVVRVDTKMTLAGKDEWAEFCKFNESMQCLGGNTSHHFNGTDCLPVTPNASSPGYKAAPSQVNGTCLLRLGGFCNAKRVESNSPSLFPKDPEWLNISVKRQGGILLHIILLSYMFAGLAIICDDYFEASLEVRAACSGVFVAVCVCVCVCVCVRVCVCACWL